MTNNNVVGVRSGNCRSGDCRNGEGFRNETNDVETNTVRTSMQHEGLVAVTRIQAEESASGSGTATHAIDTVATQCGQSESGGTSVEDSPSVVDANEGWPTLWLEERVKFCEKYPWLFANQGKIGK